MYNFEDESFFYTSDHDIDILSQAESDTGNDLYTLDWMEKVSLTILEKLQSTSTKNTGVTVEWFSERLDNFIPHYAKNFFILLEEPAYCNSFKHCCMVELNLEEGYWTYIDAMYNSHKEKMLRSKFGSVISNFSLKNEPYRCQQQQSIEDCTIIILKVLEAKLIGENSPIFLSREDMENNKKTLENIGNELPDNEESLALDFY